MILYDRWDGNAVLLVLDKIVIRYPVELIPCVYGPLRKK